MSLTKTLLKLFSLGANTSRAIKARFKKLARIRRREFTLLGEQLEPRLPLTLDALGGSYSAPEGGSIEQSIASYSWTGASFNLLRTTATVRWGDTNSDTFDLRIEHCIPADPSNSFLATASSNVKAAHTYANDGIYHGSIDITVWTRDSAGNDLFSETRTVDFDAHVANVAPTKVLSNNGSTGDCTSSVLVHFDPPASTVVGGRPSTSTSIRPERT